MAKPQRKSPADWSKTDPWGMSEADGRGSRAKENGLPHAGLKSALLADALKRGLLHTGQAAEYETPDLETLSLEREIGRAHV